MVRLVAKNGKNLIFLVKQIIVIWSHLTKHAFGCNPVVDKYMQSGMRNTNLAFVCADLEHFWILYPKAGYCWPKYNFQLK